MIPQQRYVIVEDGSNPPRHLAQWAICWIRAPGFGWLGLESLTDAANLSMPEPKPPERMPLDDDSMFDENGKHRSFRKYTKYAKYRRP